MIEIIKSIGRFFAFVALLPVVFIMAIVMGIYACMENVKIWITRTFKLEEQKI